MASGPESSTELADGRRLIILVTIPTVLGLALAGLRVTDAAHNAETYRQVGRLAVLGEQVTGLAQALEDERADTAAYIAGGRGAAGVPALHQRYLVTNGWTATVRRQIRQLGGGYPAQTRASRGHGSGQHRRTARPAPAGGAGPGAALTVINGYSAATAGLLTVNDGIADLSGNAGLVTSVRALGALSRMKEHAARQQAILGAALARGRFGPGELMALTTARAQQASDLASFRSSATPEEGWALTRTLAGAMPGRPGAWSSAPRRPARCAGPWHPRPAVAGRDVLHGRLDASRRAAAGRIDHVLRPDSAASGRSGPRLSRSVRRWPAWSWSSWPP